MKIGVPLAAASLERDMCGFTIHGFVVKYDPELTQVAVARGVWFNRHIAVGRAWFYCAPREQRAVLLHEVAHLKHFHLAWRLFWIPLYWSRLAHRMCVRQELQADALAAREGYGADMLKFVLRNASDSADYYPDREVRARHLEQRIKEKQNELAA